MEKIYTDQDLLNALKKASDDGLMGPTYHGYLKGPNRPSAEAIRARFGGWTNAVRKAGMIPAARRTKEEMKKLVKLGKVDAKYPALRMGMSVRELKVSVGLEKPRKPTKERYIDEGVRIAKKLGRSPNFHEFNRFTKTVTAWNPYRLYGRDWKAFKKDVEKRLKEKEKLEGVSVKPAAKAAAKPKAKAAAKPKAKAKAKAKAKTAAKPKPKAKPKAKAAAKPKAKVGRPPKAAKAKAKAAAKPKAKAAAKPKAKAKAKAAAKPKAKTTAKAKAKGTRAKKK